MTIDGTNISTFGLKLLKLDDYYNLPARKKKISQIGQPDDEPTESKTATVSLMGKYTDVADLISNLNAFETLLKTTLKHTIVLVGHSLTFTSVFASGYELVSYNGGRIVKINVPITICE